MIVSNPPFYTEAVLSSDSRRNQSRSESSLPFEALLEHSASLLKGQGRLSIIVPYAEASGIILSASMYGLHLLRRTDVYTTEHKSPKRSLMELSRSDEPSVIDRLVIHDDNGGYSTKYLQLTEQFYL